MRLTFLGPATVHLATWMRAFQDAGVDVSLITCHRPIDFPADVALLELKSRLPSRLNVLRQAPVVRREIAARDPDLVVAYYASSYGLLANLVSDRPYVVVTAGSDVNVTAGRRPYLVPIVRRALGGASAVVCWSDSMKDAVTRFNVPSEKVLVLPRGIRTDRFLAAAAARESSAVLRMICLRRFRPIFHHDTLIDACRLLADRGVRFHLTLCGDGSERTAIEARVATAGIADRVSVFGHFSHDAVPGMLEKADMYVALPEIDGASASLFEAMSAGLYPVVSDIPANRQWIRDGVNGALVPYDDPARVAAAIERAAADRALQQSAIDQNLEFARTRLDIRANTRTFMAFFNEVIQARSLSPS
jgi:glycosyltransferase involved in cell wall biosynthesis